MSTSWSPRSTSPDGKFSLPIQGSKITILHWKAYICTTTDIPPHNWKYTPYGNPTEDMPKDAPKPLDKLVKLTTFYDANLMHDMLNGRFVTGYIQPKICFANYFLAEVNA